MQYGFVGLDRGIASAPAFGGVCGMAAFGGVGVYATTPDELTRAVNEAMDSGKPTLVNAVIDENAGTESGRIGNLNPQSVVSKK